MFLCISHHPHCMWYTLLVSPPTELYKYKALIVNLFHNLIHLCDTHSFSNCLAAMPCLPHISLVMFYEHTYIHCIFLKNRHRASTILELGTPFLLLFLVLKFASFVSTIFRDISPLQVWLEFYSLINQRQHIVQFVSGKPSVSQLGLSLLSCFPWKDAYLFC